MFNRVDAPSPVVRWGAIYLLVQSLSALAWWFMLVFCPASRVWFRPLKVHDTALLSFFLPDVRQFALVRSF